MVHRHSRISGSVRPPLRTGAALREGIQTCLSTNGAGYAPKRSKERAAQGNRQEGLTARRGDLSAPRSATLRSLIHTWDMGSVGGSTQEAITREITILIVD